MRRIELLRRQRDEIALEIDKLLSLPEEPLYADEDYPNVIWFQKRFGQNRAYTYAAVYVNGMWFVTGNRHARTAYPWDDLVEFIYRDEKEDPEIWVAIGFDTLQ